MKEKILESFYFSAIIFNSLLETILWQQMDSQKKWVETSDLHKVNHEERKSGQILSKEIQSVSNQKPSNKAKSDGFTGEFYKMLKKNHDPSQSFPKCQILFIMPALARYITRREMPPEKKISVQIPD